MPVDNVIIYFPLTVKLGFCCEESRKVSSPAICFLSFQNIRSLNAGLSCRSGIRFFCHWAFHGSHKNITESLHTGRSTNLLCYLLLWWCVEWKSVPGLWQTRANHLEHSHSTKTPVTETDLSKLGCQKQCYLVSLVFLQLVRSRVLHCTT